MPRPGLRLPLEACVTVARQVLLALPAPAAELPPLAELPALLWGACKEAGTRFAAAERLRTGQRDLWHDSAAQLGEPVLDLLALQQKPDGPEWTAFLVVLQRWARRTIQAGAIRLQPHDLEDITSRSLASFAACPPGGSRPLDRLTVYEETEPLFVTITNRRLADWRREQMAKKNNQLVTVPELPEVAAADPVTGAGPITLHELAVHCRDVLGSEVWAVIFRMFDGAGSTQSLLAADPALMASLGVKPGASASTCHRRLKDVLASAIDALRGCVGSRFS